MFTATVRLFLGYFDVRLLAVVLHVLYIILLNNFNCQPKITDVVESGSRPSVWNGVVDYFPVLSSYMG